VSEGAEGAHIETRCRCWLGAFWRCRLDAEVLRFQGSGCQYLPPWNLIAHFPWEIRQYSHKIKPYSARQISINPILNSWATSSKLRRFQICAFVFVYFSWLWSTLHHRPIPLISFHKTRTRSSSCFPSSNDIIIKYLRFSVLTHAEDYHLSFHHIVFFAWFCTENHPMKIMVSMVMTFSSNSFTFS